jgi:hypothetical protein
MEDFNHTLTKIIIALRRFSEKMDTLQVSQLISPFIDKTNVNLIEYGTVTVGDKLTNIFILNFTDGSKIALATGNFWQGREEDYTIAYVLNENALFRMEQSGNYEKYGLRKWEDLYLYLQKTANNLQIIKNPLELEDEQIADISTPNLSMGDTAVKIF